MTRPSECACGAPATANGRECGDCFRARLGSVNSGFAPTRSLGAGQMDPAKTHSFESRLDDFRRVAAEGSVPKTTQRAAIEQAKRISDRTGRPYLADATSRSLDA